MMSFESERDPTKRNMDIQHFSEQNIVQIDETKDEYSIENGQILAQNELIQSEDDEIEYVIKELPQGYVSYEKTSG